jgi:hypothetical protein
MAHRLSDVSHFLADLIIFLCLARVVFLRTRQRAGALGVLFSHSTGTYASFHTATAPSGPACTIQVGVLFAFWRLVHLGLTTILALSRLDQCIFTVGSKIDRGYSSFLAIVLMVHVLDLKAAEEQQAQFEQGDMALRPAEAVPPPTANAALPGVKPGAVQATA